MGCGIYVKDPVSGRILYSNQRLRAFLPDDAAPDMLENCWREESGGIDTDCFHEIYLEQENAGLTITGQESTGSTEEVYFCIPSMR